MELLQRGNDSLHETVSKLRQQSGTNVASSGGAPATDGARPAGVVTQIANAEGAASEVHRCAGTRWCAGWGGGGE